MKSKRNNVAADGANETSEWAAIAASTRAPWDSSELDLAQYQQGSQAHELAVACHAAIESARDADNQGHPAWVRGTKHYNALLGVPPGFLTHWSQYLIRPAVLEKVQAALSIGSRTELLERILNELHPPNWEGFFWMQAYHESEHRGVAEAAKLEKRLAEQALSAERFRSNMARLGGAGKDAAVFAEPRAYIKSEWGTHCSSYENNKSEFARSYVRLLADRFKDANGDPLKVTERTIRETWLKGL